MYRGASVRLIHNPLPATILARLTDLQQAGCNAVSIIPHHFCALLPGTDQFGPPPVEGKFKQWIYPDIGQDPAHPFHNTPDPALVWWTIRAAKDLGMHVVLKPHLDSYWAAWRGFISVQRKTADWRWAYLHRFLAPYVNMAQELDVDLCMGTELYTVTKELCAAYWVSVAMWIRVQGFHGPLTYAANWGVEADAEYNRLRTLWPMLDYVGIDAYFPLIPSGYDKPITLETILGQTDPDGAGWHRRLGIDSRYPPIDTDMIACATTAGKPLVLTEIGYPNSSRALLAPGEDPQLGMMPQTELQEMAIRAFVAQWKHNPLCAGYYWWEAMIEREAVQPITHDLLGSPFKELVWGETA